MGECEVHRLLEGDTTSREVRYCSSCDAWMCEGCADNPARRAKAAVLRLIERRVER